MSTYTENKEHFEGLDFDKLKTVLHRNIPWVVLIFVVTITTAYLYIRWTKPVFESVSELKLDVEANATELGITSLAENQNLNVISGEIELLRSKLFFNKIIDNFDLDVSYFTAGNVLTDEKYKNSPFKIDYLIKDGTIYDRRVYIQLLNNTQFKVSFNGETMSDSEVYNVGQLVESDWLNFTLSLTSSYLPGGDENYFFVINSREALINYFEGNLVVEPLNLNANTIKIAIKDFNRYKARDLVNVIDSLYLKYSQEEKNRENKQKIQWLNSELKQIETQLEQYENYFENFTIENRTSDLDEDLKKLISFIDQLDSQRYSLEQKLIQLDQLNTDLQKNKVSEVQPNLPQFLSENINALYELILARERLKLSYAETTFAITKKDNEIEQLRGAILDNIQDLKKRYKTEIQNINERKRVLQTDFEKLPGKNTEYNKKQRFFDLYEEFYLSLMQSKAEFQIAEAGTTTQFKILSAATLPNAPISPKKLIIIGIGVVAGAVLNFVFLSLRYLLHNKITNFHELEASTATPILGSVPKASEKMEITSLIIHKRPKSAVSEALRSIRTNIEFMLTEERQRVISITSTISGEGKTFVAVNLGGIIALSKKKVVVVDLDMRKPRVHLSFDETMNTKGVSTILINKHSIQECIGKTQIDNLDYIPAGPTPPNPSELLLNGEFVNLVDTLKQSYDLVILDTPPAGLVTDGLLAMKKADLAIYIVRANYSKKVFLKTLNRLARVNQFKNISVVLNAVPRTSGGSYGYGYYDEKKIEPKAT